MKKIMLTLALVLVAFVGLNAEKVTTRLYIPEMECNNCKAKVEKCITYVKGVKDLKIDLDKRIATITFDDAKTSIAKIQEALKKEAKFDSKEIKEKGGCPGCKGGQCTGACKGHEHAQGEACKGHDHSQCQGHKEGEHKCSGECKGHEHAHGEACKGHDHSQCQGHKEGEHKCSGECKGHDHQFYYHFYQLDHKEGEHKCSGACKGHAEPQKAEKK